MTPVSKRRYKAAILVFEIDSEGKQIPGTGVGLQVKDDMWHDDDNLALPDSDPLAVRVYSAVHSVYLAAADKLLDIANEFAVAACKRGDEVRL